MEGARLKTIAILILLSVNIFLLGLTLFRGYNDRSLEARTLERITELLSNRGITLKKNAVSDINYAVGAYEGIRIEEYQARAGISVIGESEDSGQGGANFYETELGTARFRSGGSIEISLNKEGYIDPGLTEEALFSRRVMTEMGFDTRSAGFEKITQPDGSVLVTAQQKLNGLIVYNCSLLFYYNKEGLLTGISGRWLYPGPAEQVISRREGVYSKSAISVLLPLATAASEGGYNFLEINQMEPGYFAAASGPEVMEFIPVWRVITDKGTIYINAVSDTFEIIE